jgi:glutamate synthase (NADPH/NADH) small chain
MGKPGGFLDFRRKEPGYRPVEERLRDFEPVELRLEEAEIRAQAARCMDCGTPFCHGCGCPLSNIIPEINDLVYQGRWKEALELLLETNNFPEFTARVCPALCEAACVLDINDDPVTIRQIELAVIEKAFEKGYIRAHTPARRFDSNVAIIGSGPAGLAVADTLNRAGCRVTVYDRSKNPGGILRYGIPDFKLGKNILDRRIQLMKEEGVNFEMGVNVGEDVSYNYLNSRFDAVCLAAGSRQPRDLKIPGRELAGIHFAMEYLTQQNMKIAGEYVDSEKEIAAEGKDVVIIGGGDTGSDCLGTALRRNAKSVLQLEIMPRPAENRPETTPWPMWPDMLMESSSHKEGGQRRWSIDTREFVGKSDSVQKLRCVEVEWKRGADGQMKISDRPGSDFEVKAQLVLLAMGFTGPGRNKLLEELGIERDKNGNISVDQRHMTNIKGIFAAGDMSEGQSLVVRAIADGRAAAMDIMEYLQIPGGHHS